MLHRNRFQIVLVALLVCTDLYGHGQPVQIEIENGAIKTKNGVIDPAGYSRMIFYDGSEDAQLDHVLLPGGSRVALSNQPGFDIAKMAPGSGLYLDVVARPDYSSLAEEPRWLWYWGGAEGRVMEAPNNESLLIVSETGDLSLYQAEPPLTDSLRIADPNADELGLHVHYLRYLLDDEPPAAQGAYGFFATFSSPSYASSEPVLIVLNNGLSAALLAQAALDINVAAILPGDFDEDGLLTVNDLDELALQIRSTSPDPAFDVNASGSVDEDDLSFWVVKFKETWIGDANLDGEFDSNDLLSVLAASEYEDELAANSTWETGDWNADGEFTSADLIVALADGGYEQGPRNAVASVPEPHGLSYLAWAAALVGLKRRVRVVREKEIDADPTPRG